MIKAIEFTSDWRCFAAGDLFHFYPGVNLLVGDQGCGKSSLLGEIRNCGSKLKRSDRAYRKERHAQLILDEGVTKSFAFDFEHDNFRTKGYFDNAMGFHVGSMFASHGESNVLLLETLDQVEDAVIFLDEPDMALSIRSAHAVAQLFERVGERNCQVIAAVHSLVVIQHFEQVLSLEHRKWMPTEDFIATQYKPKVDFPINHDHERQAKEKKAKEKTMSAQEAGDFLADL